MQHCIYKVLFKLSDLSRDSLENDLTLLGFVVASNSIKDNSKEVIEFLQLANASIKMVTGDNLLTASSVCNQLGLTRLGDAFIIEGITGKNEIKCKSIATNEIRNIDLDSIAQQSDTKHFNFAIEGKTLEMLNFDHRIVNLCTLFARTSPHQKGLICRSIRDSGNWPLMIGDGTNDILAMRESIAGLSLAAKVNENSLKKQKSQILGNNAKKPSKTEADKMKFLPQFIKAIKQNVENVDDDKSVQPSTIASSFATSETSPLKCNLFILNIYNFSNL